MKKLKTKIERIKQKKKNRDRNPLKIEDRKKLSL